MANKTKETKGRASAPLTVPYPSKVEIPHRRPAIVRRERLVQALSEIDRRRVAVVTAPAGYGKTTLLIDFAQSAADSVCWYALDERDCDTATFLRYFAAAGQHLYPEFGSDLAAAAESGETLTAEQITDLMVAAVSGAGGPMIFVLDDFHFLDNADEALQQGIGGWVYRLPPDCHVVLSGRTRPKMAVLPMMTVRQEVIQVEAKDFSFTCDEVANLFRDVLGKEVSLDDAQHLANFTEGWAGALVLLADRVKPGGSLGFLEQLRASDTMYQYISLEQFEPLPKELKDFLLGSAVLFTLETDLVEQLLGVKGVQERIDALVQLNLAVPDETRPDVYRYHRLFRAFLVSQLRGSDPGRFKELNVAAAELREKQLQFEDVLYHLIQAESWSRVNGVIEKVGGRMFQKGRFDELVDWLDIVPDQAMAEEPSLLLWKARALHYMNQFDAALALVSRAEAIYSDRKDALGRALALSAKGMALRVKGDYEEAFVALQDSLSSLEELAAPAATIAETRKELGMTLSRTSALSRSIEELTTVLGFYEGQGDSYNIAQTSVELACSLGLGGRPSEAIGYLERARGIWANLGNDNFLVQTMIALGVNYYLTGDFSQSEAILRQGVEVANRAGNLKWEMYLWDSIADIKREEGSYQEALDIYSSVLDQVWVVNDAFIAVELMDGVANTYRLMGQITSAESWAARAMAEAEKTGGALEVGVCDLTHGLIARQRGDLKEAAAYLERAISRFQQMDSTRELALSYFHLAGIHFSLKRKRLALDALEQAAALVAALGYDHFLLLEAQRNPLLVQYGSANKAADGYYARLLKLMKASSGDSADVDAVADGDEPSNDQSGATTIRAFGFGQPRVSVGGHEISDLEWRSEKSKEMFFFFLSNRRPLRKEEIVTAMWPDMPDDKTTSAFHSNMYRLRKALYQDVIAKDSGRYVLDPRGKFVFDVEEYQQALQQADAVKGTAEAIKHLERAMALYSGQFAPDFYSEWAETLRWQMEEQSMTLLSALANAYNGAGEYKKAADICQKILERDEFSEAGWYGLMTSYVLSGQTEAAKYSFSRYVKVIAEEDMDDEDLPEFEDLVSEIKAGKLRI